MAIGALLYCATEWSGCDTTVADILIALLPTTSAAGYRMLDGSRNAIQRLTHGHVASSSSVDTKPSSTANCHILN